MIKEKLKAFGKRIKHAKSEARFTAAFWEEYYKQGNENSWNGLIAEYLIGITNAERKFIDWMFFRDCSVAEFCLMFYISERTYYNYRERVYKKLLIIAIARGLVGIDFASNGSDACAYEISEDNWRKIEESIKNKAKRNLSSDRVTVEGIIYIKRNHSAWRELPEAFGDWNAVYKRYIRWCKNGLWKDISKILGLNE